MIKFFKFPVFCFLLFIFLNSCATNQIPSPDGNDHALLVVPVIFEDEEQEKFRRKLKDYEFNLYFDNKEEPLYVGLVHEYSIKNQLKPGSHKLSKIKQNHIQNMVDVNFPFVMKARSITIAPFYISIDSVSVTKYTKTYSSKTYEWESYNFMWRIAPTTADIYSRIVSELEKHEHYKEWKVLILADSIGVK